VKQGQARLVKVVEPAKLDFFNLADCGNKSGEPTYHATGNFARRANVQY